MSIAYKRTMLTCTNQSKHGWFRPRMVPKDFASNRQFAHYIYTYIGWMSPKMVLLSRRKGTHGKWVLGAMCTARIAGLMHQLLVRTPYVCRIEQTPIAGKSGSLSPAYIMDMDIR